MSYSKPPDKARDEPLGPPLLNRILSNTLALESLTEREHTADGLHNSMTVPRGVGSVIFDPVGIAYSLEGESDTIDSITVNASGDITINLAADKFSLPMLIRWGGLSESYGILHLLAIPVTRTPYHFLGIMVSDITTTTVRLLLGSNGVKPDDFSFCFAIHCPPFEDTADLPDIANVLRGDALAPLLWDGISKRQALQQANFSVGHGSMGEHNLRETALGYVKASWNGASYDIVSSVRVTSITRTSAGVLTINLPSSTYTTPMQVFPQEDYARSAGGSSSDIFCVRSDEATTTDATIPILIYQLDLATMAETPADCDFTITIHCAPR